MKNDLVSIIIPTLNEAENIERCLQSCQKQNYKKVEIIVVDNFSKDKTLQIAKKYTNKCFLKGNERSSQRNFGAQKAKGKYLLFLDADMRLTEKVLKEAISIIQNGKYMIAFPEISIGQNFWEKSLALERNLYQKEKLLAGARLFTAELFIKLNGYDKDLIAGEDWDLTIRAQNYKSKLIFTNSPIVHKENVKNLKEVLKKKTYYAKNIYLYTQKHPKEFAKQSNTIKRLNIFLKNWKVVIRDPIHLLGFIFLKTLIWYDWRIKK